MSYTVGNWTVAPQTSDTISTPKTPSIPDLSFAADYTVIKDSSDEVRLANTTSIGLMPAEYLRYGKHTVANVYQNVDVPASKRTRTTEGVRTLSEIRYNLKATNSVSGDEVVIPMRGWICLEVPTDDLVTSAALQELLMRTLATAFATGKVDASLVTDVARGDLNPTA